MYDPNAGVARLHRSLVYLGACIVAGLRLVREKQVSARVLPTICAIDESVEFAHEIVNKVFRKVPEKGSDSVVSLEGVEPTLYVANQGVMMKLRFGGKAVPT